MAQDLREPLLALEAQPGDRIADAEVEPLEDRGPPVRRSGFVNTDAVASGQETPDPPARQIGENGH